MDYITSFDIRLEKDVYYPGEPITGCVLVENSENIKIRGPYPTLIGRHSRILGIRVLLRGKAHVNLKVMKSGERKTLRDDQYLLDEKILIWGKGMSCWLFEKLPFIVQTGTKRRTLVRSCRAACTSSTSLSNCPSVRCPARWRRSSARSGT